ncbi:MAG: dienelactone hydrolase family protein [Clostridia bacterium]|nr:dienelactone hydrolase family protein [Clostridia bacterium]
MMGFLIALAAILFIFLLLSYAVYRKAFYNRRGKKRDASVMPKSEQYDAHREMTRLLSEEMKARDWEKVHISSRDGVRLAAIYYHISDEAPLHIQFHGYRGTPYRDFCGGNKLAIDMGHNTLVVFQRAHLESEGHTISFGIKERFDCLDWINYAVDRFGEDKKIIISGLSMGAATVIMAAAEPLPRNVRGIIADCPYSSPKEIILKVCAGMGLPPLLCYPLIYCGALIFGGFKLTECDAVRGAKNAKIPILLLHGEDDDFVPLEMSRKIAEANPEMVRLHTFEGAGHGLSYMVSCERYTKLTEDFICEVLS